MGDRDIVFLLRKLAQAINNLSDDPKIIDAKKKINKAGYDVGVRLDVSIGIRKNKKNRSCDLENDLEDVD